MALKVATTIVNDLQTWQVNQSIASEMKLAPTVSS